MLVHTNDFRAFQAKMQLAARRGFRYETRSGEPSMADLAATLDKITDAAVELRGEVKQLTGRTDKLETRLSRPGLQVPAGAGASPADSGSSITYKLNDRPVPVLRSPESIRSYYEARATSEKGAEGVGMSDFFKAVANLGASPEARAVLSVGTDADGGYMVPSALMGQVMSALVPETAVLQAGAGIIAIDGPDAGAKSYTLAATDTVSSAAWRAENGSVSESSPGFRAVTIVPRSLAFYFKVSREWLADAMGTDQALMMAIAQAFAKELDRAALRGSGTAPEPLGVLNTSGIISVPNGANGASLATTKWANMFSAVQQVLEANGPMPTAAIMSPRSLIGLGQLADTTGQPMRVPDMLTTVRRLHTSQVPNNLTVGASSDCSEVYLGDFTRMAFVLRERVSVQRMVEAFATTGQVGFLCHVRADVAVMYPKAFAVVTGVRP